MNQQTPTNPDTRATAAHETPDILLPQRVRHPLRARLLQVQAVQQITPHLRRITLGGEALEGFHSPGFDDHVKLFIPPNPHQPPLMPTASAEGLIWPAGGAKPVMRDYTPRRFDAVKRTLEIDFALHEPQGPATRWAAQAQPGHYLGLGGPKGSFIVPTQFDTHWLIGDDTALPAIARRLEELPANTRAKVLLEVSNAADQIELISAAQLEITWVYRQHSAAEGAAASTFSLLAALQALPPTPSAHNNSTYAWIACESTQAKALRQHLIDAHAIAPKHLRASGYWRQGSAATHESHDG